MFTMNVLDANKKKDVQLINITFSRREKTTFINRHLSESQKV